MDALISALIPLASPPTAPGWNHADMAELIGPHKRLPAAVLVGFRDGVQPRLVLTYGPRICNRTPARWHSQAAVRIRMTVMP
jgi:hypothetical protein